MLLPVLPADVVAWFRIAAPGALGVLALAGGLQGSVAQAAVPFGFEAVAARAQALAAQPFQPSPATLPQVLRDISYDGLRDIRYRPDQALWRGSDSPFELMFFHLGKYQVEPVRIHQLTPQGVVPVAFDARRFDYGRNPFDPASWGDIGMAGWRVHYPLNGPRYKDELAVFLGASYFRALGAGQRYGLSARGLAIDTVGGQGEEFPRFTDFWIERPRRADARTLVAYALLDSPRVSGAYRFDIRPGAQTTMDVRARLFLRAPAAGQAPIATLGLAPLTSMFTFGENQPRGEDFRPEVHDSDGLMVATRQGEWLWRPLQNPTRPLTTSFAMAGLAGFGLMQRDRRFTSYEDPEAHYEHRPSAWVTPVGDWGPGRVELVQLPTPDETHDNIVAYWVPTQAPVPGRPYDIAWRVAWQGNDAQRPPGAWVTQTRSGRGYAPLADNERQFLIDFTGPALAALPPGSAVEAVASANAHGEVLESHAYRIEGAASSPASAASQASPTWRLALRVRLRDPDQAVELRAFLRSDRRQPPSNTLSETWTYILPPR